MASMLWQILLKIQGKSSPPSLTCDECFTLLDYLVSQVSTGPAVDSLYEAALKHWQLCPNCREHHLHLLQQMEANYLARPPDQAIGSFIACPWPRERADDGSNN